MPDRQLEAVDAEEPVENRVGTFFVELREGQAECRRQLERRLEGLPGRVPLSLRRRGAFLEPRDTRKMENPPA